MWEEGGPLGFILRHKNVVCLFQIKNSTLQEPLPCFAHKHTKPSRPQRL